MARNMYWASALTGGATYALDAIDGDDADGAGTPLADGDTAIVITTAFERYDYVLDADSGEAESSPDIIKPDTNAGTKRWKLATGTQGDTGAIGATGTAGTVGATGTSGAIGATGTQGDTGAGIQGDTGSGTQGDTGSQGTQGDTGGGVQGDTGTAGSQGDTGDQGDTGAGTQGDTGAGGAAGDTGTAGAQGDTGTQGDTGAGTQGDTGTQGSQGDTGIQGDTGAGTQGDTGTTGAAGDTGTQGDTGSQGAQGDTGTGGAAGDTGTAGDTGSGATGTTGSTGTQGDTGDDTSVAVVKVIADDTALTTGDGKTHFTVPVELNGMNLVTVGAHVYTVSSSGTPTVMLHNLTDTSDMLSTAITIDANELDSKDAATPPVIDTAEDDVVTGDVIRIDVDVAGTGTEGLEVRMGFATP